MGLALHQIVDNYECLGIIDKPKAGITYKVRNLATGEIEALRTLPGATSRDPESAERLLREVRIHARLSHPNIVEFHDAFAIDGQPVMTTEFVEGPTLATLCQAGPLSQGAVIAIIVQVLDALEEAHALGIVHRGITADQVIVPQQGAIKLGGFGLAKPASDTHLTRVGTVVGDPRYVSPEQVMGLGTLDGRSDLYSVGVLLYQTLTGKLPFDGPNEFEVLAAHAGSEPKPPNAVNPAISPEVNRIVLRALKKKPDERFGTAKEFRAALTGVGESAQARVVNRSDPAGALERKRRFSPMLAYGSLAVAIALALIWFVAR
jgi:serine/threonine protein kinase